MPFDSDLGPLLTTQLHNGNIYASFWKRGDFFKGFHIFCLNHIPTQLWTPGARTKVHTRSCQMSLQKQLRLMATASKGRPVSECPFAVIQFPTAWRGTWLNQLTDYTQTHCIGRHTYYNLNNSPHWLLPRGNDFTSNLLLDKRTLIDAEVALRQK